MKACREGEEFTENLEEEKMYEIRRLKKATTGALVSVQNVRELICLSVLPGQAAIQFEVRTKSLLERKKELLSLNFEVGERPSKGLRVSLSKRPVLGPTRQPKSQSG